MASATIEAAGGVLWRGDPARPEVALVHRPRYDDWSLPKGKLEAGEHPLLAGLREIEEETGFTAVAGRRLGTVRYPVADGPKRVRYWACEATGGRFRANREVDQLRWAPLAKAVAILDLDRDRGVLERFAADTRRTRALVVVRHAAAGEKLGWRGSDADRPLVAKGRDRSRTIAALLRAHDVRRVAAADVRRCRDTVAPFSRSAKVPVVVLPETTADRVGDDPAAAVDAVLALAAGPAGAAWCGQREVIPELVAGLCRRLAAGSVADAGAAAGVGNLDDLDDLTDLRKGALLVLHLDDHDQLVAIDRLPR